mmetsp:Transcript_29230/g.33653  ORF Transcript_29230/g.33653 Transcript_29230/m.33653 type:complete len:181 (-) Transcript_29230:62-604(-)
MMSSAILDRANDLFFNYAFDMSPMDISMPIHSLKRDDVTLNSPLSSTIGDGRSAPTGTVDIITDSANEVSPIPPFRWQGAYQFERNWFRQQHPFLPEFVLNKALQSTLLLESDSYHQLDDKGVQLEERRKLKLLKRTTDVVYLERSIGGTENTFQVERRKDGHNYYREWGRAYRLVECET